MSAVVLAVLVLLWAAVLVPMWLRRHEHGNEVVSTARFAGAMRTLGRQRRQGFRPVTGEPMPPKGKAERHSGARWMVMPNRPAHVREPLVSARVPEPKPRRLARMFGRSSRTDSAGARGVSPRPKMSETRRMPSPGYERRRAARVAARRRLAFLLIAAVAGSGAMAELRGGPWIAVQACADVLFVGGFVHLRHGVRAEQRRARLAAKRRARTAEAAPVAVPAPARVAPARVAPARVVVPPAAVRVAEAARAVERLAPAVGSSAAGTVMVGRLSRPATAEDNSGYGDPMHKAQHRAPATTTSRPRTAASTPAAKAPAGRRTVDLTQPGRWTEEQAAGRTEDWRPSRLLDDEVEDTSVVLRDAEDGYEDRLTEGMDAFDAIFRKAASG